MSLDEKDDEVNSSIIIVLLLDNVARSTIKYCRRKTFSSFLVLSLGK